jgi:hypothetical protein
VYEAVQFTNYLHYNSVRNFMTQLDS